MTSTSRHGLGRTSTEISFADQIQSYKTKMLPPEPEPEFRPVSRFSRQGKNPAHEPLLEKCVAVIAANFHQRPVTVALPNDLQVRIAAKLPLDLNVTIAGAVLRHKCHCLSMRVCEFSLNGWAIFIESTAARYVHTETYWKRRAIE